MNYRLTIQYDGGDFHGWQAQGDARTVQGELERTLSLLDGRDVTVHGAGRTDAGVHALGQTASVALNRQWDEERLHAAINGNLHSDVRVFEVESAPEDFHARFSAKGKTYRYRIFNARFMSPLMRRYALHESRPLNVSDMLEAAKLFEGEHDWTAFSSAQADVASRVRRLTELSIDESEEAHGRLIDLRISAEGFLRYMARSIAGALLAVGRGEIDGSVVLSAIEMGVRHRLIATAPAHGLTLLKVHY